jgi:5'-nucleotidase
MTVSMPRILVTNDDGVHAPGIAALADALRDLGEVTVVAPHHESSAIGHALTLARPLRLDEVRPGVYSVDGTPTDCVNVAVTHVLPATPDLIVSGINTGWNIGDDVTYSGTVSGALEAALLGIPAIAVSAERKRRSPRQVEYDFPPAARVARVLAEAVLERGLPRATFLNVNVPFGANKGLRVTVQGRRNHVTEVGERHDPRGRRYFWIEEGQNEWEPHDRSDYQAVRDGYVSVTPLQPDLTALDALEYVEQFVVEMGEPAR